MTARILLILEKTRGHRPRLQCSDFGFPQSAKLDGTRLFQILQPADVAPVVFVGAESQDLLAL